MLSVYYQGKPTNGSLLGVCPGGLDLVAALNFNGGTTPRSISGVDGVENDEIWVGRRDTTNFQIGADVPDSIGAAAVAGTAVAGSLASDPAVLAVLDAVPRAAAVEMGTLYIGRATNFGQQGGLSEAVALIERERGISMPTPNFGGYGWTASGSVFGTGTFVTTYPSTSTATTAAEMLSGVWSQLDGEYFKGAATTVTGTTVVTTVPSVQVRDYDFRSLKVLLYPGWGHS